MWLLHLILRPFATFQKLKPAVGVPSPPPDLDGTFEAHEDISKEVEDEEEEEEQEEDQEEDIEKKVEEEDEDGGEGWYLKQ